MLWSDVLIHFALVIILTWMGIQDRRTREVSNVLTIPMLAGGVVVMTIQLIARDPSAVASILIIAVLTFAALRGWMGGADWKVLVGLFGLWPLAGFASLAGAGLFGAGAILWTRDRHVSFPAIYVFAVASLLTFSAEVSIIAFS
ncbi:MAG: prepilin peptidase [Chloroflexota bacterium]|nr:MAG: prepilin peptidase [Chloroflexota bacterium]